MNDRPYSYKGSPQELDQPMLEGHCTYGQWLWLVEQAENYIYLVVKAGGMARKSDVDFWLSSRYGITESQAHDISNHVEFLNRRVWGRSISDVCWLADRPEPIYEEYGLDPDACAFIGWQK